MPAHLRARKTAKNLNLFSLQSTGWQGQRFASLSAELSSSSPSFYLVL